MSESDPIEAMRQIVREVLGELVPQMRSNGHRAEPEVVPQVPPPPVAAVLRPSTWSGPTVPGEVIGGGGPRSHGERVASPPPGDLTHRVETVKVDTDEDLARFVRGLLNRLQDPQERGAIEAGRLRFSLQRRPARRTEAAPAGVMRIAKGAVTERTVGDAAAQGARIMLGKGAVLTPLARDRAGALGVKIEKESSC